MRSRLFTPLVALALLVSGIVAIQPVSSAEAANGALFDPGYIISDAAFYDGNAMSAADVQAFIESKVSACTSGYQCLRDYRQNTPTMVATRYCQTYAGATNERASDIIAKVGKACGLSQKSMLVLLEKEQSLVTMRNPSQSRLDRATGFSCPDTAPCDPAFAGFFYQIYNAARQFQIYAQKPELWNYQVGRVNNILFHPNRACGTAPVFIQNKATAGLYIYTPYQPNAAALANLYGTGDACSSYGNRNFWSIFTDWFGSPTASTSLVRTTDNSTVYLLSGETKYPIPSMQILTALAPLGKVGFVSQSYLDGMTTGHTVGRTLRSPDGTIFFFDAGVKLPLPSCALAVDYGASCAADGYVQLTAQQINSFATGPMLTSVLGTTEGARYYISGGTKAEILDDASQALAGITASMTVLSEGAVAQLTLADPIIRDSAFVLTRATSNYSLLANGLRYSIPPSSASSSGVPARTTGSLWATSLQLIAQASTPFTGVAHSTPDGVLNIVTADGRLEVAAGGLEAKATPVLVAPELLDSYPLVASLGAGSFIMTPGNATVYIVMPTDIRPISGWGALLALTNNNDPVIYRISPSAVAAFPQGPVALTAGTLVRSPENATVYFVNGVTSRIALSDFLYTTEAGFSGLRFVTEARIQAYPADTAVMTFGFKCEDQKYIAAGGQMHKLGADFESYFSFAFVPLDQFTCGQMKIGSDFGSFIRTPNGSIFQLVDGEKRPITTMSRFVELSGGEGWLNVHQRLANFIPTGPLA